jgi:hypothetical protein
MTPTAPTTRYVSVPAAARLLGIGPKSMGKLLDGGKVAYIQPLHHRRVCLTSLLRYRDGLRVNSRAMLATVDDDPLND